MSGGCYAAVIGASRGKRPVAPVQVQYALAVLDHSVPMINIVHSDDVILAKIAPNLNLDQL